MNKPLLAALLAALVVGCEKPAEVTTSQETETPEAQQPAPTGNAMPQEAVVAEQAGSEMQPAEVTTSRESETADNLDTDRADALGVGHSRGADPHIALKPEQHIHVALQHRAEGRIAEALVVLDQAIEKFPQSGQLYAVRSDLRRDSGDLAGALADIEQAVRLNPESATYLVGRSQLYLSFERLNEAEADLTKAIELDPGLIAARFNRGTLYAHNGDYDKAIVDLEACIDADPHLAAPYFNRGSVYYNLGRKEEAISDIKRFIELADVESWKVAGEELLKAWQQTESDSDGQEGPAAQQ